MAWTGMQSSQSELWDYLSPFETYEYVSRVYADLHRLTERNEDKIRQIAAAFGQGRMYFGSAEQAPLGVKSVLLYYGVTALLAGLTLMRHQKLTQRNWPAGHGVARVDWKSILYKKGADILGLKIKAQKQQFQSIVGAVWQGHVETLFYGRTVPKETAPYVHRLGPIQFGEDGSVLTFSDLAARSRYTGGNYGSFTRRARSLSRCTVWSNPHTKPQGLHVTIAILEVKDTGWFFRHARRLDFVLLGPKDRPNGAIFPRGDLPSVVEDSLPVFHYERDGQMSICEPMPNGDRPNELIKLYLMAYVVGMLARYYPPQWLEIIRGTAAAPDTSVFVSAVTAIEHDFIREFAGQLAILIDDPYFFSEHFGHQARTIAPDWRAYLGGTGTGKPIIGASSSP